MISIIICSRKAEIDEALKQNIAQTIGCEYELFVVDNSRKEYSIFSAYNEGVKRVKGDVLCFMHEDVKFHSQKWGCIVTNLFETNNDVGLIGVIGGQFIPNTPSSYWEGGATVGQIIQGYHDANGNYAKMLNGMPSSKPFEEVAAVDGLWLCIPARLFKNGTLKWDIETFHGFHCYDMDMCYQVVSKGLKVMVARDIRIEHFSYGNMDAVYCEQSQLLYDKWHKELPFVCGREMTQQEIEERTKMVGYIVGNLLLANKIQSQYDQIRSSKAYRLGKAILKPLKWLKR